MPLPGGATAVYNSSGLAYYRHSDWLGSSRLASTQARGLFSSTAYAPFGERYGTAGTADASFTGQNSDTTSSLYDFLFREHSPSQGRWISPDAASLLAVDAANPQSWNRYGYALNNPVSFIDSLGLTPCPFLSPQDTDKCGGGEGGDAGGGAYIQGSWTSGSLASASLGGGSTGPILIVKQTTVPGDVIGISPDGSTVEVGNPSGWPATRELDPTTIVTVTLVPGTSGAVAPGGGGGRGGTAANNAEAAQGATEQCQKHGQLKFNIPFTYVPVTLSLSATGGPANYSATNDITSVFPLFPLPEWLAFGASLDITVSAPDPATPPVSVGVGKNASIGSFATKHGFQGVAVSIGPSIGPPVNLSVPAGNACGIVVSGAGG